MLPLAVRLELACQIGGSFSIFGGSLLAVGFEKTRALAGVV